MHSSFHVLIFILEEKIWLCGYSGVQAPAFHTTVMNAFNSNIIFKVSGSIWGLYKFC